MEIAVLIPAYQPDSVLISLVQALHRENFRLIVTDDGSGPAYADIFSALLPYAEVLTCPENRGKGRALKCALRHLAADPQGCRAFITADADGQQREHPAEHTRHEQHIQRDVGDRRAP